MQRLMAGFTLVLASAALAACQQGGGEIAVKPDDRLGALLANGDAKVLGVEELGRKDGETRQAELTVQSAKEDTTVAATVDMDSGAVLKSRVVSRMRSPFTKEQLEQATALALRDPAVRQLLGGAADQYRVKTANEAPRYATEGFLVASEDPADPCSRSRCIDLLFIADGRYLAGNRVTVNLGTAQVSVAPMGRHGENH